MTWLTHEVGAAQMRAAARRGLPPDPSHRSDDPCPWGLCPEDEWTRTTGYSGGASTAPDRARMTIQTTNTDRLRAIGVVTDGTHGPFIDPDKVLALAARFAAPSDGLREALANIREICKPMSRSMSGPVWFDGGRERIWRIADAALDAATPTDDAVTVISREKPHNHDVNDCHECYALTRYDPALAATPTDD
jgi:hypothetical protein